MTSSQNCALETAGANRQYITFHVGTMFFGIEVLKVQELLRFQEITPIPLSPPVIAGLINLRGQIVTTIQMRERLKMAPGNPRHKAMNIVVRSNDGPVSLLVDDIGDVVEASADNHEAPPETLRPEDKEIISGVCKLESHLLLLLDTDRLLQRLALNAT